MQITISRDTVALLAQEFGSTLEPLDKDLWECHLALLAEEIHCVPLRVTSRRMGKSQVPNAFRRLRNQFKTFLRRHGITSTSDVF